MKTNKIRRYVLAFTLILILISSVAFLQFQPPKYEFLQVTSIESVVSGGVGRSRLITTKPDGDQEEVKLKNFFSLVGINFGNIRENDTLLLIR